MNLFYAAMLFGVALIYIYSMYLNKQKKRKIGIVTKVLTILAIIFGVISLVIL
jgi:Na+-driven multidrug efflux pump